MVWWDEWVSQTEKNASMSIVEDAFLDLEETNYVSKPHPKC